MKRLLPMIFALLLLPIGSMQAHATLWLCSTGKGAERDGNAPRAISRNDIIQAYSGQPVLLGGAWLLAYMLPIDSADTKAAFLELGISPAAAPAMTKNSLVDRGIRIAKTPKSCWSDCLKTRLQWATRRFF